jgi:hypothetical protein
MPSTALSAASAGPVVLDSSTLASVPTAAAVPFPVATAIVTVYRTRPTPSASGSPAPAAGLQLTTPQMVGLVMAVALGISALGVALALVAYRYRKAHPDGSGGGGGGCCGREAGAARPVRAREGRRATVCELEARCEEKMRPQELDGAERFELPADKVGGGARADRGSWVGSLWRAIRSTRSSAADPG